MRAHLSYWGLALALKGLLLEAGFIWTWLIGLKDSRYISRGHISNSYRAYNNKYTQISTLKMKATYPGLRDPEAEHSCGVHIGEEIPSFIDTFLFLWLHYLFILLLRGLKLKCFQVKQSLCSPDPLPWRKHLSFGSPPIIFQVCLVCASSFGWFYFGFKTHLTLCRVFFIMPFSHFAFHWKHIWCGILQCVPFSLLHSPDV